MRYMDMLPEYICMTLQSLHPFHPIPPLAWPRKQRFPVSRLVLLTLLTLLTDRTCMIWRRDFECVLEEGLL